MRFHVAELYITHMNVIVYLFFDVVCSYYSVLSETSVRHELRKYSVLAISLSEVKPIRLYLVQFTKIVNKYIH